MKCLKVKRLLWEDGCADKERDAINILFAIRCPQRIMNPPFTLIPRGDSNQYWNGNKSSI